MNCTNRFNFAPNPLGYDSIRMPSQFMFRPPNSFQIPGMSFNPCGIRPGPMNGPRAFGPEGLYNLPCNPPNVLHKQSMGPPHEMQHPQIQRFPYPVHPNISIRQAYPEHSKLPGGPAPMVTNVRRTLLPPPNMQMIQNHSNMMHNMNPPRPVLPYQFPNGGNNQYSHVQYPLDTDKFRNFGNKNMVSHQFSKNQGKLGKTFLYYFK